MRYTSAESKFWSKVDKSGGKRACWMWTSALRRGYGVMIWRTKLVSAHRFAWELAFGSIPDGLCVLHHCDNPPCVNPKHLFIGTILDNNRDRSSKGRTVRMFGDSNPSRIYREYRPRGSKHGLAKLTESKVIAIRRCYALGNTTQQSLAAKYKVCKQTIFNVLYRKIWTHI